MSASLHQKVRWSQAGMHAHPSATVADDAARSTERRDGTTSAGSSNPEQKSPSDVRDGSAYSVVSAGSSPAQPLSAGNSDAARNNSPSAATVKRPGITSFRRASTLQLNAASRTAGAPRGGVAGNSFTGTSANASAQSVGSSLCKPNPVPLSGSPNIRLRHPLGCGTSGERISSSPPKQQAVTSGTSLPVHRGSADDPTTFHAHSSAAGTAGWTRDGSATSLLEAPSTLTSAMSVSGLTNHLRLSEGLNCVDYHPTFRALAIGSTRQIHMVEVMNVIGHDVAGAVQQHRVWQQHQQQKSTHLGERPEDEDAQDSLGSAAPSEPPASPPPLGPAPFLLRNTGVFGGLIKVESVAWYPSTEEASLAFIQPARTVTIFLDAIQFKADGTYLPQQWTRSQYKGKTLTSTMAAGGGSTAMAVVANLDCLSGGITPALLTPSLGGGSGPYTPASASLAGGPSFGVPSISHGSTPHDTNFSTPSSTGYAPPGPAASSGPYVVRNPIGPLARELIELNIDITYMRVEKIVWDPHHPYTLALSSPATHFELWQVPTDGPRVYAPQLVLRPPAHNTRSVVRDIVFSPSNPHIIIVVTECGNTGQVLLYDRRQVEAMRRFDISGPGLSAAFHPLFSDLLAVCFRREKTKPDTRVSFLQVMSNNGTAPGWLSLNSSSAAASALTAPHAPQGGPLPATSTAPPVAPAITSADTSFVANVAPTSTTPYLAEQTYLPPIDNYACINRMRWRPPSMGQLMEPKGHHYMTFKPSAQALCVARNSPSARVPSADGSLTWADLLHSQLWFASAAMTTDTDLSIWDAANGFFPVCFVKYLSPRGDTTTNESNDFVWINELTLVTAFKSGDVVCTSFVNSPLEGSIMTSAQRVQLRTATPHQQQQLQQQRQQFDPEARDELGELYSTRIAEEEECLAMLPEYVRDPYADLFTTFTVLPTTSIVSDLFGYSYTIRSTNATLRRSYHQMIRRDCGQLVRRLAIQVSREAVLREQWTKMRSQTPGVFPPTGSGMASGRAALQEHRSRRPCSPFTQTGALQGQTTSSQGSDSTPPSPRRGMRTRHYSAGSSLLSIGARQATMAPVSGGGRTSGATAGPRRVGVSGASNDGGVTDQLTENAEVSGNAPSPCPELSTGEEEAVAVFEDPVRHPLSISPASTWLRKLFGFPRARGRRRHRCKQSHEPPGPIPPDPSEVNGTAVSSTAGDDSPEALTTMLGGPPGPGPLPKADPVVAAAVSAPAGQRQPPPSSAVKGAGIHSLSGGGPTTPSITLSVNVTQANSTDNSGGSPRQVPPTAPAARARTPASQAFSAYSDASANATTVANTAFPAHYDRISSSRGGISMSSLPLGGSSFGVFPSATGDLDRAGGGIAGHCGITSGASFTQLFPLLQGFVHVHSSTGSGGGERCNAPAPKDRSETQRSSRVSSCIGKQSARTANINSLVTAAGAYAESPTSPVAPPASQHEPQVLTPTTGYVVSAGLDQEAATMPPLPLPHSAMPISEGYASGGPAVAAQLMQAHAYLDSKRDVTTVIETFVLSDPVCHWSYTEKQAEQLAFVCFALEWDMGYELALAMKALRQKRADAEAAAEVLATSEGAFSHRAGPMPPMHPRDADIPESPPSSWWRSSSSGRRQEVDWGPKQQAVGESDDLKPSVTSAREAGGQARPCLDSAGTPAASRARSSAPNSDPTSICDWGNGVPVPSHEDVDDKVAAMMEENARICERVMRERREAARAGSESHRAHTKQGRPHRKDGSGVAGQSSENAAATTCSEKNEEGNHPGDARTSEVSNEAACDPRAQWWRAAAHAWRSHHVSFIISITAQQLEYAGLMGDVQYSIVLYILFCLWWRLHSEVAEAAYAVALEARARQRNASNSLGRHDDADDQKKHKFVSPQSSIPLDGAETSRHRAATMATGIEGNGNQSSGRSGSSTSGVSADILFSVAALQARSVSTTDDEDNARKSRIDHHPPGSDDSEGDAESATSGTSPSLEKLKVLSHLCLFFLHCPMMPSSQKLSSKPAHHAQPPAHWYRSASIGTLAAATRGGTNSGNLGNTVSLPMTSSASAMVLSSGGGETGVMNTADTASSPANSGLSKASASTPRLPSRGLTKSSPRFNSTPKTPSMVGSGSPATAAWRRRRMSWTLQGVHQPGNDTDPNCCVGEHDSTTSGKALHMTKDYVDVEGLRGVRLYPRSRNESPTPDDCSPEEWKIRALQWLETYTADLYARQLYVPLNELLLIMPEIFREPTNPVQPRAADVAYEKQMTYVYCGACSKAELWSRTQQETVPAAVRLYERVVRRDHHSSSSGGEEMSDEDEKGITASGTLPAVATYTRHPRDKERSKEHHATAKARRDAGAYEYYANCSNSSSDATTPSVESPTSSILSCEEQGFAAGVPPTPAVPDVSLSSEHSDSEHAPHATVTHDEAAPPEEAVSGREMETERCSSFASTTEGSHLGTSAADGRATLHLPAAVSSQRPQSTLASRPLPREQHHRGIARHPSRRSRRSLDDADDAEEWNLTRPAVNMARPPARHTVIGCDECNGNFPANNAACRHCHNPTAMTCVICEEVVEGMFFWLRSCGHGGHVHHIEEWLRYSQECPKCGVPITQTWRGS